MGRTAPGTEPEPLADVHSVRRREQDVRRSEVVILAGFLVCTACSVGLWFVYANGGDPQFEGPLLGVAFAGLAVGLVTWAHRLLPHGPYEEERRHLGGSPAEQAAVVADFERGGVITRRRLLLGGLATAAGAMGIAALFPLRSLGPSPDRTLERTPWRRGKALVTSDGSHVRAADVPAGGLVTVFPEGHPDSADGQAVLLRVPPRLLRLPRGRARFAPRGLVCYSKVCTHAGCPVGLYQAATHQLLCPCHQSAFDVLRGARPVLGPAARPLPQLLITIDADGVVRALGDFPEPIGPSYWNRP